MRTPDLFGGIRGIAVRTIGGGLFAHTGESVQFTRAQGYCTPTLFIEIYRRPGEVPIEYAVTSVQPGTEIGTCEVLVVWTKSR